MLKKFFISLILLIVCSNVYAAQDDNALNQAIISGDESAVKGAIAAGAKADDNTMGLAENTGNINIIEMAISAGATPVFSVD